MCPPPLTHPHGTVVHFSPGPPYPFGTKAEYFKISCPEGMKARGGNSLRTCTSDGSSAVGVWNGTAPVCAGSPIRTPHCVHFIILYTRSTTLSVTSRNILYYQQQ